MAHDRLAVDEGPGRLAGPDRRRWPLVVKRVCLLASASGSGKTTLGRALADRIGVPFYELDALNHGPAWTEASADELRARVAPLVAADAWVIDGGYRGKLGDLVLARADTVVWLDLPRRVWLPRLLLRTAFSRPNFAQGSGGACWSR